MTDDPVESTEDAPTEQVEADGSGAEVEEPSLGPVSRVVRTLMLLASTFVVVVALPIYAWQMTSLAEVHTSVDGQEYVLTLVKRHGQHAVQVTESTGETYRIPLVGEPGERLDGRVSFEVEEEGRLVVFRIGDTTRRVRYDGAGYELEKAE